MEAGRLLLRRLRAMSPGERIGTLCRHYRSNAVFLVRRGPRLTPAVRARMRATQKRLERTVRAVEPACRFDAFRKGALHVLQNVMRLTERARAV